MLKSWFGDDNDRGESLVERSAKAQSEIDEATRNLALYHYESCWFSRAVRTTIKRLQLKIELRDIHSDPAHHNRLISDGGSATVPCLYIEEPAGGSTWLYESRDISTYLEQRFGVNSSTSNKLPATDN